MKNLKTSLFTALFVALAANINAQWNWDGTTSEFRIRNNTSSSRYFDFRALNTVQADMFTNLPQMRLGVWQSGGPSFGIEMQYNLLRLRASNQISLELTSNNVQFRTNNIERMRISGDRIGINISAPNTGLHIHERTVKLTGLDPEFPGYAGPSIVFANNTGNNGNYVISYNIFHKGLNFWKPYPAIDGGVTQSPVLFMSDQGRVGIKTYNATADLTVNGSVLIGDPATVTMPNPHIYSMYVQKGILAEKLKIALHTTSDWSDFVFAPNYRLRSLREVELFIQENGHLPEVPSAETLVEEGGYDVLQMDALLLMKIEELTLYMIELQKKNEELQKRVIELENQ